MKGAFMQNKSDLPDELKLVKSEVRGMTPDGTLVADAYCIETKTVDHINVTLDKTTRNHVKRTPPMPKDPPRTFVIKYYDEAYHDYFYLSRMWSPECPDDHASEYDCRLKHACRFTSKEALQAFAILRQELCDRKMARDEEHFKSRRQFFCKLYINDIGSMEVLVGEPQAFLEWVKLNHSETLNDLLTDYLRWKHSLVQGR